MRPAAAHPERHAIARIGWLRAAVLGANDGIVSTACLVLGVAASGADRGAIVLAGLAGLTAGAMSMAAGEYVSVSSQADTEKAALKEEAAELQADPGYELKELTQTYRARGLDQPTAEAVARQLTAHDALAAHARDELGITEAVAARPLQAAAASAITFSVGAAVPLLTVLLVPAAFITPAVVTSALLFLMLLGFLGARAGKAPAGRPVLRVAFWGSVAMAVTWGIGRLAGTAV
ncbi:VIT family protein [Sandaracinobacter sp. RS1-74]|uniref:VIT1/CCC1 transporter family protein n=1 Tax=Sandaracinobacteroides sayramensis TaxID=2913411 RepID=UPI001EDC1450|nr:VIT family protein [Sandaracinobacteroides sayramensis]MCG2841907.1 VIT family protein [Sandaracinobacteroides sayramensis]